MASLACPRASRGVLVHAACVAAGTVVGGDDATFIEHAAPEALEEAVRSAERMMGESEASGTGESLADLAMERVVKDEAGMKRVHDGSGGGDNDDDDDLYGGIGVSKRSKRAHLALHSLFCAIALLRCCCTHSRARPRACDSSPSQ